MIYLIKFTKYKSKIEYLFDINNFIKRLFNFIKRKNKLIFIC